MELWKRKVPKFGIYEYKKIREIKLEKSKGTYRVVDF